MTELIACPFCNSTNINDTDIAINESESTCYFWVCPDCICCGPIAITIEGATDGWNTRGNIDPQQQIHDNLDRHNDKLREQVK